MRVLDKVELRAVAGGTLPPSDHNQPPGAGRMYEWGWTLPEWGSTYTFDVGGQKAEVPPKSGETAKDWFTRAERVINEALDKLNINVNVKVNYERTKPNGEKTSSSVEVKVNNGAN